MLQKIKDHLYTQLRVNLIKENVEKTEGGFEVSFKFNAEMADVFFNDENASPNEYIGPIKVHYDKNNSKMYFEGNKEEFSSAKNFNKFLTNVIRENSLSLLELPNLNTLKSWLQEKILKSEVNYYKLDKVYEKAASIAPILKKDKDSSKGDMIIDAGQQMNYIVDKESFMVTLVEKMDELDKWADKRIYAKKLERIKERELMKQIETSEIESEISSSLEKEKIMNNETPTPKDHISKEDILEGIKQEVKKVEQKSTISNGKGYKPK